MSRLECLAAAVIILAGLVIGLIVWSNGVDGIDLSSWARWLMEPGNDLFDLIAYYAKGAW